MMCGGCWRRGKGDKFASLVGGSVPAGCFGKSDYDFTSDKPVVQGRF